MSLALKVFQYDDTDKIILTTFTGDYSTRDILKQVDRYKSLLHIHDIKGKKVALLVPSIPDYISLVLAANELGAAIIPLSWQFRKDDLAAILEFLDPHIIFSVHVHSGFRFGEVMAQWAQSNGKETLLFHSDDCSHWEYRIYEGGARMPEPAGTEFICCSSGSTGLPKGMVIGADCFDAYIRVIEELTELTPEDRLFCNAPSNSVYGMACLFGGLHTGARVVYPDRIDFPQIVMLMEETGCNKVLSTPSVFKAIYTFIKQINPDIARNIELCGLTGEMMAEGMAGQFELMERCKFIGMYGSSEIGGAMYCDLRQQVEFAVLSSIAYKIVEGELLLKSGGAFSHYYRNPQLTNEAFDPDGWFYSGDLVRVNERNKLQIIGRKKDMIKKGGQQVIPGEIERILTLHPRVAQAVVIGAPHPVYGEQIVAFVVPDGEGDERELYAYCAERIAGYKVPDRIVSIPEIPVAQGKVDKVTLRNMCS